MSLLKSLTGISIFPQQRISACLRSFRPLSTPSHEPQYNYILSRNLVSSKFSSSWVSIQDSPKYNRGIYATAWLPAGTVVLEELPVTSILKKTGLKDPYDLYCPYCFMPQHTNSELQNHHIYCSESCSQDSMMVHQIREYKQAREFFESQLRYYPILAINLFFEILKQFKSLSHSAPI
ncbi:hypothetical protein DSO57_1032399 [Entomophthora muscae]|uniref:Uncharacterized protein n=1 Tax=Entomophthora muscae TaxID=34485 RepID=A0ACC2RRE7_9FUNG|nr:hypothetical protein DSO57_1032399 [Entomophthora muscae]